MVDPPNPAAPAGSAPIPITVTYSPDGRYYWDPQNQIWREVPGGSHVDAAASGGVIAPNVCNFCGGSPALRVSLRSLVGMLVYLQWRTITRQMCRDCGTSVFRKVMTTCLSRGWWSFFCVVLNPVFIARNLLAYRRLRALEPAVPASGRSHLAPELPLRKQTGALLGSGAFAVVAIGLLVWGIIDNSRPFSTYQQSFIGKCIQNDSNGDPTVVSCLQPNSGIILGLSHGYGCPSPEREVRFPDSLGMGDAHACVS